MNTLIRKFESDIDSHLKNFLNHLSIKYKIPDILNEFDYFATNNIQISPSPVISTKQTCNYIFIKGQNEGNKCHHNTLPGILFCKAHSKHEENGQKDKKIIPKIQEKNTKQILISNFIFGD